MLQFMLCGAHDVGDLSGDFAAVTQSFGANPLFYQQGTIQHVNSRTSRWTENSRATVRQADVCVFVIMHRYGDITWNHELQEALERGRPFVVLALESAWNRYRTLLHALSDLTAIGSPDDQKMVGLLRLLSVDYQITVTPFTPGTFREKLVVELSSLFEQGIRLIQTRSQRSALLDMLSETRRLTPSETSRLIDLAMDEYEDKRTRKTALVRLASEKVREGDFVESICRSHEQGVQRLAFGLLPDLLPRPIDEDLLHEIAQIAGSGDDVGVQRRLISAVADIDPTKLDVALNAIGSSEIGLRRRAFEGVEEHWSHVLEEWGVGRMRNFLQACEGMSEGRPRWLDRLRSLRDDLT
jgi:hypothetical protein